MLRTPRSRMEGREPAEVTEYEYEEGVLVRSVTTREPLWTEEDTAEILALAEYEDSLCPDCGFPRDEVNAHERVAPKFVISRHYCWASKAMAESQHAWMANRTNGGKKQQPPGDAAIRWTIRKA
jgi:hypothetical protein